MPTTLEEWLAWYNVIFVVSMCLGVLFMIAAVFGGDADADLHPHVDVPHHVDIHHGGVDHGHHGHDHDHGHDVGLRGLMYWLGIGKVPLGAWLMMTFMLFGGIGVISNLFWASTGMSGSVYGWISLVVAAPGSLIVSSLASAFLGRFLPKSETTSLREGALVGSAGKVVHRVTTKFGQVAVIDQFKNEHIVYCVAREGELPVDAEVALVEFLVGSSNYVVVPLGVDMSPHGLTAISEKSS